MSPSPNRDGAATQVLGSCRGRIPGQSPGHALCGQEDGGSRTSRYKKKRPSPVREKFPRREPVDEAGDDTSRPALYAHLVGIAG